MTKEEFTKIVNFTTPGAGLLMIVLVDMTFDPTEKHLEDNFNRIKCWHYIHQ